MNFVFAVSAMKLFYFLISYQRSCIVVISSATKTVFSQDFFEAKLLSKNTKNCTYNEYNILLVSHYCPTDVHTSKPCMCSHELPLDMSRILCVKHVATRHLTCSLIPRYQALRPARRRHLLIDWLTDPSGWMQSRQRICFVEMLCTIIVVDLEWQVVRIHR